MTRADLERHARELPIDEQLELAQALWENAAPPVPDVPTALAELLEARRAEALADPDAGPTWEEVRTRLRRGA